MTTYPLLDKLTDQAEQTKVIDAFGRMRDSKIEPEIKDIAMLTLLALSDNGMLAKNSTPTVHEIHNHIALAICLIKTMPGIDESRYTMYDYMDAVINANQTVDIEKLLSLDEDYFAAAMIWLATNKRETYESREHAQEPLELDIFT